MSASSKEMDEPAGWEMVTRLRVAQGGGGGGGGGTEHALEFHSSAKSKRGGMPLGHVLDIASSQGKNQERQVRLHGRSLIRFYKKNHSKQNACTEWGKEGNNISEETHRFKKNTCYS